jgi:hypothetical protein
MAGFAADFDGREETAMLAELWRWLVTGRYTRTLEEEIARLRVENRALVNSLLGTAGVPPLHLDASPAGAAAGTATSIRPWRPVRRRSWQQIGRMLELEEARRAGKSNSSPAFGGSRAGAQAGVHASGGKIPCGEMTGTDGKD